jgi:hypothetical protein
VISEILQVLYSVGLGIIICLFNELRKARLDLHTALKENREILRATTESNNSMANKIILMSDDISKLKSNLNAFSQANLTRR